MAELTILHNPRCSNSRAALTMVEERGLAADVVRYLEQRPDRQRLTELVAILEDPVQDLVRNDAHFAELGLDPADYVDDAGAVVELLERHPELLQRPVLIRGGRAIIGRPRQRVVEFLA